MKIAERIYELRTEMKISQQTLADEIGVSRHAITFWESGINEPKATYIARLAKFFGVSADYLLGLEE